MKEIIDEIVNQLTNLASRDHPSTPLDWHDFINDFMAVVHCLEVETIEEKKLETPLCKPQCAECSGQNIVFDAFATWNTEKQFYELDTVLDKYQFCNDCEQTTTVDWV